MYKKQDFGASTLLRSTDVKTPADRVEAKTEDARAARRRFLKASGAMALAVPVIESVTGRDLLTVSAQAQSGGQQGINGAFTGDVSDPFVN